MIINPSCWNEHDELKTVMVCSPSTLDVPDQQTAADVHWMRPVNREKIHKNHEELVRTMQKEGVQVIDYADYLTEKDRALSEQLINRFFVRDLACVFGYSVIPGVAGRSMRKPEYHQAHHVMKTWFDQDTFLFKEGYQQHPMEFGDVLVLNKDAILINVGMRTSIESVEKRKEILFAAGFSEIGVIDLPRKPEILHLDMSCNMVGEKVLLAKFFMRYFPLQRVTERGTEFCMLHDFLKRHNIDVVYTKNVKNTISDVNFLNLNPDTLLVSSQVNQQMFQQDSNLKRKNIIQVDVEELEKGGGGIRCMTLPLVRSG